MTEVNYRILKEKYYLSDFGKLADFTGNLQTNLRDVFEEGHNVQIVHDENPSGNATVLFDRRKEIMPPGTSRRFQRGKTILEITHAAHLEQV